MMGALLRAHNYEAVLNQDTIVIRKRPQKPAPAPLFEDRSDKWDEWKKETPK